MAVVDWPGSGGSASVPLDSLTGGVVCLALAGFIDHLGEPVILMTHSMSGPFGWRLLETQSAQITAVVAIAPGPPGNIQPTPEIVERNDDIVVVKYGDRHTRVFRREYWLPNRAFAEEKLIGTSRRFPRAALPAYAESLQPLAPQLMLERLNFDGRQLVVGNTEGFKTKPILMVTGTEDRDHSRERDGEIATWLGANGAAVDYWYLADLGINGNGHMMMLEDNSDEIAGLIAGWIDGIGA